MNPEEKSAYYRALGARDGKKTVQTHGREHMRELGKKGFQAALNSIGGQALAKVLGNSYREKFGHDPDPSKWKAKDPEKEKVRARARREYREITCVVCGAPAERHHIRGTEAGNDPSNIEGRCRTHHMETHRERRR